jgi:hypothetical protein
MSSIPAAHSLDQLWAPLDPEARKRPPVQSRPDTGKIRAVFAETDLNLDEQQEDQEAQVAQVVQEAQAVQVVQEVQQDAETRGEASDGLAESFAPWRTDSNWQPPALPRYGPPLPAEADPSPEQRSDSQEFRQDEFLR